MARASRRALAVALTGAVVAAIAPATAGNGERRGKVEVRAVEPVPIPGGIRLAIRLSGPAEFRWRRLREPERVYVDIEGARLPGMPYELRVGWGGVERLWARQNAPDTVRVVAGLTAEMEVEAVAAEEGRRLHLDLRPRGEGEGERPAASDPRRPDDERRGRIEEQRPDRSREEKRRAPERREAPEEPPPLTITEARFLTPPAEDPATISSVTARNLSADRAEVRVQAGRRLSYKTLRLENPARFVVDLTGGRDGLRSSLVVLEEGLLGRRAVRVGQFSESPPVFRVVVELPKGAWGEVHAEDSGELVVEVARRPTGSLAKRAAPGARPRGKSPWGDLLVGIDAGHGGSDPGALSMVGISEKEITLDIALRVRELLTAMRVNTTLTRADDRRLPKEERIRFVSRKDLDLFISIHCDAAESPSATGVTTYTHGFDPPSRALAACIQGELVKAMGLPDRGVCPDTKIHRTGFYILRNAACPAVLIEAGFVSHAPTALQLSRPEFRQRAAQGIVDGLRKYWDRIHGDKLTRR
jgi:N-acetylmuramoyl-L-alanine amidase